MYDIDELLRRHDALEAEGDILNAKAAKTQRNLNKAAAEAQRVATVAHNAKHILDDLDREFEEKTKLNGLDITFMFLATAIQCARWYILDNSKFKFTDANEGEKLVKGVVPEDLKNTLSVKVPYDRVGGHRYRTLGHDPIMGWIFGPVNILSDSATMYDLTTVPITTEGAKNTMAAFSIAFQKIHANPMQLPIAVARQALHFGSDYFTREGLPLPFIMTADKALATQMLRKFHIDMWSVTRGAALASLVNMIVGYVHSLFYDTAKYSSPRVYEVKTRKIIRYSNIIASTSNVIYTAISGDLLRLDVGGILVTLWRLFRDRNFKQQVKREFITESFNEMIRGEEYDFE